VVNAGTAAPRSRGAGRQAATLGYFPVWSYAHPAAIELAERLSTLTPGDLNRVFFTSGGSEAVESAWKLARQYHKVTGNPNKFKIISRNIAYHGTTMGALSITGIPSIRTPFEPLVPGAVKVPNTNFYRATEHADNLDEFGRWAADAIAQTIEIEGPETVAAVILEPVQNSGGSFPPRPDISSAYAKSATRTRPADLRRGDLRLRRLGEYFAANRYGLRAGHHHLREGPDSGYAPLAR